MAKCKCSKRPRVVSNAVREISPCQEGCVDVCANPICAEPRVLSVMAPLIYDEIGINLCTTFELGVDVATTYPTVTCASVKVINATYTYGENGVSIDTLAGRPNCYGVTLSNLTVQFAVNLYDAGGRLVDTIYPTAVYLPSDTTAPTYDEETNPSSVELEIFAPYGYAYAGEGAPTPVINYIGYLDTNNLPTQGINLYSIAKLIDFEIDDSTVTVGLTLVLQSMYYAGYKVASAGRIDTPKGSIISPENTECMMFVAGDLLDLEIKPLDLGAPRYEERYKNDCADNGCGNAAVCDTDTVITGVDAPAE